MNEHDQLKRKLLEEAVELSLTGGKRIYDLGYLFEAIQKASGDPEEIKGLARMGEHLSSDIGCSIIDDRNEIVARVNALQESCNA